MADDSRFGGGIKRHDALKLTLMISIFKQGEYILSVQYKKVRRWKVGEGHSEAKNQLEDLVEDIDPGIVREL